MKKSLLVFIFSLSLIFAFSVISFAQEMENIYYVVQSEESELASSLKSEGKNIVGIERLYSSQSDSTAEESTYFLSQFDGHELNLILAENVSYCMSTNPSNPWGSGIRLDKAVSLTIYFNGHYWWIPDDNRYAGFFINNQYAHLTLIGNRTHEEVAASFDLSKVNAKTVSNSVDYYGGYIGFYLEKGNLTIKNAIIIGEDEVIYQKDNNASGTSVLHFDTCLINNKDKTCKAINLRSAGKTDITIQMNHVYTDKISINNILADSYIKNSSIVDFITDSWHADKYIGKDYIYISDSSIGNYTSLGDTQHIIAINSTFNKIDLVGDTSGGGFATLTNSTYASLSLKRSSSSSVSRNGVLNVLTVADCVNAATKTVYTYDDLSASIVSTLDAKYSQSNPALGHDTMGEMLSISYTSYLERGNGEFICSLCDEKHLVTGAFDPLFMCLGYSVLESNNGSFAIGYRVNNEAITFYEENSGNSLGCGVFAVLKTKLGSNNIFSSDGTPADGAITADLTNYDLELIELKIVGITEQHRDLQIAVGAYVSTTNGGGKEFSYLQNGTPNENEKYHFTSYSDVLDSIASEEVITLEDIVIEVEEAIELTKSVNIRGEDRALTYSFEGEGISINDYVLTGLVKNTKTTVTVTSKGYKGTFTVQVVPKTEDNYKYVVVIGVDGAGAFFKDANTPNIDSIFENGATTYSCLTADPTISAQCWGSLMHGVVPSVHGLTNDIVSSTPYPTDSKYPSFFRVIRENDENAILASFCNWNPINVGIVENDIGVYKVGGMSDSALTAQIITYLESNTPTAMFVQFDEADGTGHSTGYGAANQLAKISEIDSYIGQIYEAYERNGMLDETLFIVTSDHGGSGNNHGGLTDTERYVMFAAAGKTVEKGTIEDMEIRDTAAIVLHALGYELPEKWTSRVPSGLFEGVIAEERPVINDSGRHHKTEPTPENGSEAYVTNFIENHTLSTYLTFDGNIEDAYGKETTQSGTLSYEDGYFGEGVVLDSGYVSINDFSPGTDSFTVALWIKTDGVGDDPCIFSNKNWSTGKNTGFAFAIRRSNDVRLNFGDGYNRADCDVYLPSDYKDGWVHLIAIFDRENNKLGVCIDFNTIVIVDLPAALQDDTADTIYDCLNIGQDGTGNYNIPLTATVDEFMIFDGAFNQEDVLALAEYYRIDK